MNDKEFKKKAGRQVDGMYVVIVATLFIGILIGAGVFKNLVMMFIIPAFMYFISTYLYKNYSRFPCPKCGNRLRMNYKLYDPILFGCEECGFYYDTGEIIGDRFGQKYW